MGLGNREMAFISGELGNKCHLLRGTKALLGNREHIFFSSSIFKNMGTSQFISGEQRISTSIT